MSTIATLSGASSKDRRASMQALRARARRYMSSAAPRTPQAHLLENDRGHHVFVPDGSQLFDASAQLHARLDRAIEAGELDLAALGLQEPPRIDDTPLASPPLRALSLAVAQKCNLGCTYCYAEQGQFGGAAKNMALDAAKRSVDLLVADAQPDARLNLAFLGGEPLMNRGVLREATLYAEEQARRRGVAITFSITSNGTLLTEDDADFFEAHGFAVTISLDGPRDVHDALRPYKSGRGSFDRVMHNVAPLLRAQGQMQVSARVTVTPRNLALRRTLDELIEAGFHSVGFSALLRSPNGGDEMAHDDLEIMLGEMMDCGDEFVRRQLAGQRYPFANVLNAMREIHRGTHRPYPCGAGAGYLGVSAEGELSACHRFVDDDEGAMGSLDDGVDHARRNAWLDARHVHRQEPCNECWARYLCGGGCHHESIHRGRPACDYIRGWLHYCLEVYLQLTSSPQGDAPPPGLATMLSEARS